MLRSDTPSIGRQTTEQHGRSQSRPQARNPTRTLQERHEHYRRPARPCPARRASSPPFSTDQRQRFSTSPSSPGRKVHLVTACGSHSAAEGRIYNPAERNWHPHRPAPVRPAPQGHRPAARHSRLPAWSSSVRPGAVHFDHVHLGWSPVHPAVMQQRLIAPLATFSSAFSTTTSW